MMFCWDLDRIAYDTHGMRCLATPDVYRLHSTNIMIIPSCSSSGGSCQSRDLVHMVRLFQSRFLSMQLAATEFLYQFPDILIITIP
jgi:hypothetical protein